jgi:hypothetical protein
MSVLISSIKEKYYSSSFSGVAIAPEKKSMARGTNKKRV